MTSSVKPIFLFADSQLLFWQQDEVYFLREVVHDLIERDEPCAAYMGASNDYNPEFYGIFVVAMEILGIKACCMIPATASEDDLKFLRAADLILLAGGDAVKGWRAFEANGLRELLVERYFGGAILMGVSAGAMQLGLYAWPEGEPTSESLTSTLGLAPFIIGAHDEKREWAELRRALGLAKTNFPAIGIPTGGGMIYHADHSVQPLRLPLQEFWFEGGELRASLLYPDGGDDNDEQNEIAEAPYVS